MIDFIISLVLAAIVYWILAALGLPHLLAVLVALLVILMAFGGLGRRRL